jgi:hypothetical protein
MHSYVREISCGLAYHNIITAVMTEYHLDLQGALNWLGTYSDAVVSRFLSNIKRIPSWDSDTDKKVQTYIKGLGQWVRGNDDWSYESKRYHGDDGLRIREDRILRVCQRTGNYLKPGFDANANEGEDFGCKKRPLSYVEAVRKDWQVWWMSFSFEELVKSILGGLSSLCV